MLKLIKSLFSGSPSNGQPSPEATVEYDGFRITPCPQNTKGSWSTEAIIEKDIDGETRRHHFIRADHSSGKIYFARQSSLKAPKVLGSQS
ncbi:MAG: hypothetical protein GKR95_23415 [Gammaproteobacteria bacterium]|nr:hypothetical protein [Gammaproteobacteria bacterium]